MKIILLFSIILSLAITPALTTTAFADHQILNPEWEACADKIKDRGYSIDVWCGTKKGIEKYIEAPQKTNKTPQKTNKNVGERYQSDTLNQQWSKIWKKSVNDAPTPNVIKTLPKLNGMPTVTSPEFQKPTYQPPIYQKPTYQPPIYQKPTYQPPEFQNQLINHQYTKNQLIKIILITNLQDKIHGLDLECLSFQLQILGVIVVGFGVDRMT